MPAFGDRDSILPLPGLLLVPLLLSVPRDQREGEDGVIVLLGLGLAAGLGLIALLAHRQQGRDRLVADGWCLHIRSRRGDRELASADVLELGWVTPGQYRSGGLAGRLREGGPYDVPGPAIAGSLCQPLGRVRPDGLHKLMALARSTRWPGATTQAPR